MLLLLVMLLLLLLLLMMMMMMRDLYGRRRDRSKDQGMCALFPVCTLTSPRTGVRGMCGC